jgi:hypothetical protein
MGGRASPGSTVVKTLEQEADECYQSILLPINERMMGPLPQVLIPVYLGGAIWLARAHLRKVDGFAPRTQLVNMRIVW